MSISKTDRSGSRDSQSSSRTFDNIEWFPHEGITEGRQGKKWEEVQFWEKT